MPHTVVCNGAHDELYKTHPIEFTVTGHMPTLSSGSVGNVALYKLNLPPYSSCILKDYMQSSGLYKLFNDCITSCPRSFTSDNPVIAARWNVKQRHRGGRESNMYWISPYNGKVHQELLLALGSCGFDVVLRAIASIDGGSCRDWTVFQLTFIVVSRNDEDHYHLDYHKTLSGDVWTVMIPLVLVQGSPPELWVMDLKDEYAKDAVIHSLKYEEGVAVIFGPLTYHSTSIVAYRSGYRVCLSVSVGCINVGNVKWLISDIAQQYPPRRMSLLLDWAKTPHFSAGMCHLPLLSHESLLGSEWMLQYRHYLEWISCNGKVGDVPISKTLQKWIIHQRYCFSVKNSTTDSDHFRSSRHVRSAYHTLTSFREFMLHKANFCFHVDRDEGANQLKWIGMYNQLKDFIDRNGHSDITRSDNSKLYAWIRTQRAVLGGQTVLSVTKRHRIYLLKEIGINITH